MRETGLFDMFAYHIIGNVKDCVSGIEVGMDTNARKNRGGHATEWLVSGAIEASGFKSGHITRKTSGVFGSVVYLSNMKLEFPRLALDPIAGEDNADKRFDFVVKAGNCLYDREANFHSGDGSKLNETARSYKETALASRDRVCFEFAQFTDGDGWKNARWNLKETFLVLGNIYNIAGIEQGVMRKLFI